MGRHLAYAAHSGHALLGLSRELKQHSLAEWRAAREQEEREITAQLAEQQQLQKQVCIAAAFSSAIATLVHASVVPLST